MTIDKAIEILTINNEHNPNYTDTDRRNALRLGIEALKKIKELREDNCSIANSLSWPLYGEAIE